MNIVLVHGFLGFREKFGIEYFRGAAEHLTAKGHKVIAPILDATGGIEDRGGQLRDQINAALANGSLDAAQKTHIFAHSMGGLDNRWMLSPANPSRIQAPIRSLTTISTPHRGSPIATWLTHRRGLRPSATRIPICFSPRSQRSESPSTGCATLPPPPASNSTRLTPTIRRLLTFPSPEVAARASLPLVPSEPLAKFNERDAIRLH